MGHVLLSIYILLLERALQSCVRFICVNVQPTYFVFVKMVCAIYVFALCVGIESALRLKV